jgi:benzoyl-CoA reductase subunit C
MIGIFQEWQENRHNYAKEWKKNTGGQVMGYYCSYVPEEILYAAHILPVRLPVSHEPRNLTEPHPSGMSCPLCQEGLSQGLQDRYDTLDGIMVSPTYLPRPRAFTGGPLYIPVPFCCSPPPHQDQSPRAYPFLPAELAEFKKSIEEWTNKKITDADLDRGLEILDESRFLMGQAFETRKKDNPPLTGLEAIYLRVSSQWIDKPEHNRVLKDVLEKELPTRDLKLGDRIRLMILGSEDDDTEFVKLVESLDAQIVIEDHCTGTRYFWNAVVPADDRLAAIAARYVDCPPCPTRNWPQRRRLDHVLNLAKDWKVQGGIIFRRKFCDPQELDGPTLRQALEGIGVPSLSLEPDVTVPVSQFKIRVEAFLETLRPEDLF